LFGDVRLYDSKIIWDENTYDIAKFHNGLIKNTLLDIKGKVHIPSDFYINLNMNYEKRLIFIDNIEVSSEELNELNPNLIKSVSVLKSKDLLITYGEKGKNGVILIETKKE
jgi:hypothetical protein